MDQARYLSFSCNFEYEHSYFDFNMEKICTELLVQSYILINTVVNNLNPRKENGEMLSHHESS